MQVGLREYDINNGVSYDYNFQNHLNFEWSRDFLSWFEWASLGVIQSGRSADFDIWDLSFHHVNQHKWGLIVGDGNMCDITMLSSKLRWTIICMSVWESHLKGEV